MCGASSFSFCPPLFLSLSFSFGGGGTKQEGGPNLTDDEKEKASKRKKGRRMCQSFSFLFCVYVVSERRRRTTTCGDAKSFLVTIGILDAHLLLPACVRARPFWRMLLTVEVIFCLGNKKWGPLMSSWSPPPYPTGQVQCQLVIFFFFFAFVIGSGTWPPNGHCTQFKKK